MSIFSELNILDDITINKTYSSICGYTESELISEFKEHLQDKNIDDIRYWYNGYSWTGSEKVYNPFSILNYLKHGQLKNYWFETGTPKFLIELFRAHRYYVPQIEEIVVSESVVGRFEIEHLTVQAVLFQGGYLTIKSHEFDGANNWLTLTCPNLEIRQSLTEYVLTHYSADVDQVTSNRSKLLKALRSGEIEKIREIIYNHFETIPHDWYKKNDIAEYKGYYASVFYSYFASIGVDIRVEDATNKGKVDMTVLMPDKVLIFEFKAIKDKREIGSAIKQIKEKRYAEKYESLDLPIYLVGLEFDRVKRNVKGFQWESVPGGAISP